MICWYGDISNHKMSSILLLKINCSPLLASCDPMVLKSQSILVSSTIFPTCLSAARRSLAKHYEIIYLSQSRPFLSTSLSRLFFWHRTVIQSLHMSKRHQSSDLYTSYKICLTVWIHRFCRFLLSSHFLPSQVHKSIRNTTLTRRLVLFLHCSSLSTLQNYII